MNIPWYNLILPFSNSPILFGGFLAIIVCDHSVIVDILIRIDDL